MAPSKDLLRSQLSEYENAPGMREKQTALQNLYSTYKAGLKQRLWSGPCFCSRSSREKLIPLVQKIVQ